MAYSTKKIAKPKIRARSFRLTVSVIIALAAIGCKIIFPNATAAATTRLRSAVNTNWDYAAALDRVKDSMTSGSEIKQLAYDIYSAVFFPEGKDEATFDEEEPGSSQAPQGDDENGGEQEEGTAAQALPVLSFRAYSYLDYIRAHGIDALGETTISEDTSAILSSANTVLLAFKDEQSTYSSYALPDDVWIGYVNLAFDYTDPFEGPITSFFGFRDHPITNEVAFHYGVDMGAQVGECVDAFASGVVEETGYDKIYGNYVLLRHAGGIKTFYGHLDTICVSPEDHVTLGQKIGTSGQSGLTTGAHLHFGIKYGSKYLNPLYYIGGIRV